MIIYYNFFFFYSARKRMSKTELNDDMLIVSIDRLIGNVEEQKLRGATFMWPKSSFFFFFPLFPWEISLYSHCVRRVLMFHSRYAAEQSHCCLWTFLTQRLDLMTRRDGHMGRHEGMICHGSELLNSALMNSSAFVWHSSAHVCRDSQRASFCWCHASPTPKSFYSSRDTDNICL